MQFAVEPLCVPKTDADRKLGEQFWADLPALIKEHKFDRSFWFELHECAQFGHSYLQQRGDTYRLKYQNPMDSYWNRYHFDRPVRPTVDPKVLQMASTAQKHRLDPHLPSDRDRKEAWNALELATHYVLRYLNELTECGPLTLPTINGKNPLSEKISEKIAELDKRYKVKFDPATNTFA